MFHFLSGGNEHGNSLTRKEEFYFFPKIFSDKARSIWILTGKSFFYNNRTRPLLTEKKTHFRHHSRPQRPRSFWSVPRIVTSGQVSGQFGDQVGQVQHRKSAIHACSESSLTSLIGSGLNLLCLQIHLKPECRWTWSEVAILGADQKECGHWGRECTNI